MNYLSGALRYVAGGEAEPENFIPRLVDRLKTSALPHDRRAAILHLTEAAKESPQHQAQVGELALKIIYAILEQDSEYEENVKAAVELLISICAILDPPPNASDPNNRALRDQFQRQTHNAATTNIDAYLGLPNALPLLLQLLEKDHFYVKFGTIELLAAMAANSRQTLQAAVLEAPQGVARICDVLDDSHRHIRSNAVLLLSTLCDGSSEICKIVVFGGVLEKLFSIIDSLTANANSPQTFDHADPADPDDDDTFEDAIVVQDVFAVVRTLVNGTPSTKTFFRDSACVPRLVAVMKRAAADAAFTLPEPHKLSSLPPAPALGAPLELQARKNLIIVFECIAGLVNHPDDESRLIKNDFATLGILKVLATIAFGRPAQITSQPEKPPSNVLQVRVAALNSISMLVRGHDDFRALFGSSTYSTGGDSDTASVQVTTLRAMLSGPSSAVRLAAYTALRESYVVDAGLDLPSTALLNAMTNSGASGTYSLEDNKNLSHGSLSSTADTSSLTDSIVLVAQALKEALIGWPNTADASGVFYAASFTSWILAKAHNARERLLGSYINGSSLMPQVIRLMGKLEREKGPPEVRISLFSLMCVWLHESPSAVSTFLSSAMHLPMLVDVIKADGTRGDVAHLHVRGLAAVLLGICLQATDANADSLSDGGFLSGGGGASIVVARGTVADVLRSRIGVTFFLSCLEDLRESKAFGNEADGRYNLNFVQKLVAQEERDGYLSLNGSIGHEKWYQLEILSVANDVYKYVGTRAMDLVSEPQLNSAHGGHPSTNSSGMNGHVPTDNNTTVAQDEVLADSARDEVLQSYKEFIRNQDESLNAARHQIDELSAALREAQIDLDSKASLGSGAQESEGFKELKTERNELLSQKEALESLLAEKTADFEAVSSALATLEEDQSIRGDGDPDHNSDVVAKEVMQLRSRNTLITQSLDSEMRKNMDMSRHLALLDDSVRRKDVEIKAILSERDSFRGNLHPDAADALRWRSRAEIAEASLQSRETTFNELQSASAEHENQVVRAKRARDEAVTKLESVQIIADETKLELESLRSARERELQVSRDSSATSAAAQNELEQLKAQFREAQLKISEQEGQIPSPTSNIDDRLEKLKTDYSMVCKSLESSKTDLFDSKEALAQWQKRADVSEAARDRQSLETTRLTAKCQDLEGKVKILNDTLIAENQNSTASINRKTELEQQCSELEELRRRGEDETEELKQELALRTEQSIRLSGQMYELEESKATVEQELLSVQDTLMTKEKELTDAKDLLVVKQENGLEESAESNLTLSVSTLTTELANAKEALAESRDREDMVRAQVHDREAVVSKVAGLQIALDESKAILHAKERELGDVTERLLSLDEAEDAKRALTMQVVELQKALDAQASPSRTKSEEALEQNAKLQKEKETLELRLMEQSEHLQEGESNLKMAREKCVLLEKEKSDLQKQVAEADAMLSVLQSERDAAKTNADSLMEEISSLPSAKDNDTEMEKLRLSLETSENTREETAKKMASLVGEYEKKDFENQCVSEENVRKMETLQTSLTDSEKACSALSSELEALVGACKVTEKEMDQLGGESKSLQTELCTLREKIRQLQLENEYLSLIKHVDNTVTSIIASASLATTNFTSSMRLEELRKEQDSALFSAAEAKRVTEETATKLEEMQAIRTERNEVQIICAEQKERLSHMLGELANLRSISGERDRLRKDLGDVEAKLKDVTLERDHVANTLLSAQQPTTIVNENTIEGDLNRITDDKINCRMTELEGALRDAAYTVSATNKELLAAQALLVELSSDKTAMRAELTTAEQHIHELAKQVCAKCGACSVGGLEEAKALSEVSEADPCFTEKAIDERDGDETLLGDQMKCAEIEVNNLQTALSRSLTEADSAVRIVGTIFEKVNEVEKCLLASNTSLQTSLITESVLEDELRDLRTTFEDERKQFGLRLASIEEDKALFSGEVEHLTENIRSSSEKSKRVEVAMREELDGLRSSFGSSSEKSKRVEVAMREELDGLRSSFEDERKEFESQNVAALEEKAVLSLKHLEEIRVYRNEAAVEVESLKAEIGKQERDVFSLEKSRTVLTDELKAVQLRIEEANAKILQLEVTSSRANVQAKEAEEETQKVLSSLTASEMREEELRVLVDNCQIQLDDNQATYKNSLNEYQVQLDDNQAAYKSSLNKWQEKWDTGAEEYEEEIDRCTQTLEEAERGFRDVAGRLKINVSVLESETQDLQVKLRTCEGSLAACITNLEESNTRFNRLKEKMDDNTNQHVEQVKFLGDDRDMAKEETRKVCAERNTIEKDLRVSENAVSDLTIELKGEGEQRSLLEVENQEFAKNVEWLEHRCKRLEEDVVKKTEVTDGLDAKCKELESCLTVERKTVASCRTAISQQKEELKDVTSSKISVEQEARDLQQKLQESKSLCEDSMRDNEDLRNWVGDLERQANELQTAASDFEEVEQSLRETLELQRQSAEQVTELTEKLRKERDAVRSAEGRVRKAEREQEGVEETLTASEERAGSIQQRLVDIRESSIAKLSASEAGVRAQAKRCAELETSLAEVERKLAESGRASDEAFSAKAEVRRANNEVGRMRERCQVAEGNVEALEAEVRMTKEEMNEMQTGSNGEAMRVLEAEHNELLVYLADLELELTMMKEGERP